MASLHMPYQCMQIRGNFLFAASGSKICLFGLDSGLFLASGDCKPSEDQKKEVPGVEEEAAGTPIEEKSEGVSDTKKDDSSPPAKKRRLSVTENGSNEKPKGPQKKERQQRPNAMTDATKGFEALFVTAMVVTSSGQHVIAVTGEDKSIRVFETRTTQKDGNYALEQISCRTMPKRPSAVTITSDETTIISADKFGDVYSLPLIQSETYVPQSGTQTPEPTAKPFIPAANELTIHSQRNLRALANQKRQTNKKSEKSEPAFEHTLLLGHVSLLTDISLAAIDGRNYIITADRDEHIRISRGIPQAHIIENFCLGHTDFISRFCIPQRKPEILISGGGEDELLVWDWRAGSILSKTNIKVHVKNLRSGLRGQTEDQVMEDSAKVSTEEQHEQQTEKSVEDSLAVANGSAKKEKDIVDEPNRIVVSGIYNTENVENGQELIIVTCEGVNALFIFHLTTEITLDHLYTIQLPGNALSIVTDVSCGETGEKHVVVSIDNIYALGSVTERVVLGGHHVLVTGYEPRKEEESKVKSVLSFTFQKGGLIPSQLPVIEAMVKSPSTVEGGNIRDRLAGLLYTLENLRKRDGESAEE